jgi:hydrogenase maturation protease
LGNTLMADDGVGVAVIDSLADDDLGPGVELVSGATAGMALVHHFVDSDLVIVIDAISTEAEPGAIFRFDPDDAGVMNLRSNNIHGMGLPYMVTAARLKGARPEVLVFAVQVEDVSPRDMQLSAPVAAAAVRVRELILEELAEQNEPGKLTS